MPLCFWLGWVRAKTTKTSPTEPWVMNVFEPLSTQRSPFRTAVVFMPAASEPLPGSVSAQAPKASPVASRGRYFRFWASEPKSLRCEVPRPLCEAMVRASEPSYRAISSTTTATARLPSPEPPRSSLMRMPKNPSCPSSRTTSVGKRSS